jgi:hypothetical protein
LVFKRDISVRILAAGKSSLMHQVMMVPTKQYQVIQTRFATIRPVLDVVSVYKSCVGAAGKATAFVSCSQSPAHGRWYRT